MKSEYAYATFLCGLLIFAFGKYILWFVLLSGDDVAMAKSGLKSGVLRWEGEGWEERQLADSADLLGGKIP